MAGGRSFGGKGAFARALALPRRVIADRQRQIAFWPLLLDIIEQERQARRLFLWLAPLSITGALLYAAADTEPSIIASALAVVFWSILAFAFRHRSLVAMHIATALAVLAAGFFFAALKTHIVAAPVLDHSESGSLSAIIESIDKDPKGARMVLHPLAFNGRTAQLPDRVRVKGPAGFHAGDHIIASARLMPPPETARPGGYDFAHDAYFNRIGAVGALTGKVENINDRIVMPWTLQIATALDEMRNIITARVIAVIGGQSGAVAAALMTGKRGMITDETNDDLRSAGIYHVVSISGLHMVLAAGMTFFILRFALSLIPAVAVRWPIKHIAAAGAMIGALIYDIFAGSEVATERSLIMTLFIFGAILVGRPAMSMRNLALATLIVVAIEPDSVTGPSFQMSFAAVAALIAAFERRAPVFEPNRQAPIEKTQKRPMQQPSFPLHSPLSWPAAIGGYLYRHARTVLITTMIAEAATAPYSAFHFQRFQPLGLIGNGLSIPLIEMISMPLGFIGLIAMPFGLDAPFWTAMGWGVAPMLALSHWVASLPISSRPLPAISIAAVLILSLGLVWIAIWSTRLRYAGILPVMLGIALGLHHDQSDLFIARDGQSVALRMADGRLHVMGKGASGFILAQWLAADGDLRSPDDPTIRAGPICNRAGCIAKLADGRPVILGLDAESLNDDCAHAAILVTPLHAPEGCQAFVIDKHQSDQNGAIELTVTNQSIALHGARNPLAERPWIATHKSTVDTMVSDDIN